MVSIKEAILVEGRYDKNTLSQVVDAPIFMTNGFGILNDRKQITLLRKVAMNRGLIVFTDSDGAGLVIRNYIKSAIPPQYLKHAYIPEIMGKERRKNAPGKEGKLGVEGMSPDVLLDCLRRAGANMNGETLARSNCITKQDLVGLGLSGGVSSSEKRRRLLQYLQLPTNMSANAMLQALTLLYTLDELKNLVENIME